jgi:hypothetical protein
VFVSVSKLALLLLLLAVYSRNRRASFTLLAAPTAFKDISAPPKPQPTNISRQRRLSIEPEIDPHVAGKQKTICAKFRRHRRH